MACTNAQLLSLLLELTGLSWSSIRTMFCVSSRSVLMWRNGVPMGRRHQQTLLRLHELLHTKPDGHSTTEIRRWVHTINPDTRQSGWRQLLAARHHQLPNPDSQHH